MIKVDTKAITFSYTPEPVTLKITYAGMRKALGEVRDALLSHVINGGGKKLDMEVVCDTANKCGTAACIGGWASIFLLGFEAKTEDEQSIAVDLFDHLIRLDDTHGNCQLRELFYDYHSTDDYNEPNVAATAIQRYLKGLKPWPRGEMPKVLEYTKRAPAKRGAKKTAKRRAR